LNLKHITRRNNIMGEAVRALGTTLTKGVTVIGELTEINGLELSADTIDVTTLNSSGGYRDFIAGFKDAGEISISGFFYPGDAGQSALITAFESGASDTYTITFPSAMGATWTVTAIVTGISTSATLEDPVTFEGTIKVIGAPSLGTTASGGLTALSLTGAGGSLTPTFANDTYSYTFSGVTATSVTVTATAASHTLKLYIDDVYVQDLTTAVASSAIALAAIGTSKRLTIVSKESGKTPKTYYVTAVKVS